MGMYDTVTLCCPNCSKPIVIQSKAGKCDLIEYKNKVPASIAYSLVENVREVTCQHCGLDLRVNSDVNLKRIPIYLEVV